MSKLIVVVGVTGVQVCIYIFDQIGNMLID